MKSLKTKLVIAISVLIIILFSLTAVLFVSEKQKEFTNDIFVNARSFAELTATKIVSEYNLYLPQKSFVYFNRDIRGFFEKFQDLATIKIVKYAGEIVYDSKVEFDKQYIGDVRRVADPDFLKQIQSKNSSVMTLTSRRVVFLKQDDDGNLFYVDENEKPVEPLSDDEKIEYLVQPATDDAVVVYGVSYESLQDRINQTMFRTLLLAFFGVSIGVFMAYFFAGGITRPLKMLTNGVRVIAKGDFKHRVHGKTKD